MIPKISEAEWRIMKILWNTSPLTASSITEQLVGQVKWSPKTVKTLLNRLVNKKAIRFTKEGRIYHYFPAVLESECARAERQSFLGKVYNGALKPMLAAFLEDGNLTQEEIDKLKQILEEKEGASK